MNAKELSEFLSQRAPDVCQWIFPNGKKQGREWLVGSTSGEKGKSLSVCLSGEKAGIWSDFATGETGDLLDLIGKAKGLNLPESMNEASRQFGLTIPKSFKEPKKEYSLPERPKSVVKGRTRVNQFGGDRGLSDAVLSDFKVAETVRNGKTYITLPYLRDGVLVNIKYRNIDDKKDQRQEKGAEPCLFGWHLIDPNQRMVIICEGEFDAMALHQCGLPALSVNQGAGNHQWIDSDYQRLERFSHIVIWFDNDAPGQKGAREVGKRLGMERCLFVESRLKDANDTLLQSGSSEVCWEVSNAKIYDPEELRNPMDFTKEVWDSFFSVNDSGPSLYLGQQVADLRFRGGEITTWTGENGHGKSALLNYQTIWMMNQNHRVCVFSGEMGPAKNLNRYVRQLVGKRCPTEDELTAALQYLNGRLFLFNLVGNARIEKLLEVFGYAAKRYGVSQFVIDSLMTTDVPEDGNGFMEKQRQAMNHLMTFADKFNVHVHLIAHPRKLADGKPPTKNDIAGSGKIAAMSHNVCAVWANIGKQHGEEDGRFLLYKQRNGDRQYLDIELSYVPECFQYDMDAVLDPRRWI